MTYYEKIISGGPDTLAEVLTNFACGIATSAAQNWLGYANDIPESVRKEAVKGYREMLLNEYKEESNE